MTWKETFDLFVGTYVAALGSDKTPNTKYQVVKDSLAIQCLDPTLSASEMAFDYVAWRFGHTSKPVWFKPKRTPVTSQHSPG